MLNFKISYFRVKGCLSFALTVLLVTTSTTLIAAPVTPLRPQSLSQPQDSSQALANYLLQEGIEQYQAGQREAAIQSWQQALTIYRELRDYQGEADALIYLGKAHRSLGKLTQAIEYYQQHLELARKLDDLWGEGAALGNLGLVYYDLGEYATAIEFHQKSLEIGQKIGDSQIEANALANLGIAHRILGDYVEAIDYFKKALVITQELNNPHNTGIILGFLANAYAAIGYYDQALEYQEQSLNIARKTENRQGEGTALANLGATYADLGKYDNAIERYLLSLDIAQEIGNQKLEGSTLANLGSAYHAIGNVDQAIEYYQKSLILAQKTDNSFLKGKTLSSLGLAYENLGNYSQAIEYHEQSLAIFQSIKALPEKAVSLNNLAHTLLKVGQVAEADQNLQIAVDILDSLRTNLDDATHISIFDTQVITYSLRQQVLVAKKQYEAALEMSERGRTRAFTELLSQKMPANAESLSATPTLEKIKKIAKTQNATLVEYSIIPEDNFLHQGKLLGSGAELYIWVVKPTGQIEFRRQKIDQNHPLEKLVSNGRTCILKNECRSASDVTPDIVVGDLVTLNNNSKELEVVDIDREKGIVYVIYTSWRNNPDWQPGDEKLRRIEKPISEVHLVNPDNETDNKKERLQQLHQLLIQPIKELLPIDPESRIIFIPEGELFLVPFPALQNSEGEYLIEKHTILTIPSIQILDFTRQLRNSELGDNFESALVVGNPTMPTIPVSELTLDSLENAETEAKAIEDLLKTQSLIGSDATKAAIIEQMPNASLIHLATHGLLNEIKQLGIPGAIALAPPKEDKYDGFLTSEEIMEMKLKAQLVVLSACNTGKGEITGDGVIGLSRSFIAAGVPSVIVSLWSVPDAPTAELMTEFYQKFTTSERNDKAQALRLAMLKIMAQPKYRDPKNWAAFTLIGEAE